MSTVRSDMKPGKFSGVPTPRVVTVAVIFLLLTYVAHWSGQILQIGGAQLAPSIAVYIVMAVLLSERLGWVWLTACALCVGWLTLAATSSPYPLANVPAHGITFLLAAYTAKWRMAGGRPLSTATLLVEIVLYTLVSWTLFSAFTWWGLADTPFADTAWTRFGMSFGEGYWAWWAYGLLGVAVPSAIVGLVLAPVVYKAAHKLI